MYKPKILWVGEFTQLHTGYAVYGRELLSRLLNSNKYIIAEQACYCNEDDNRRLSTPWKVYPNGPLSNNQQSREQYLSTPVNQFGYWRYNDICLDFEPDIVISITDPWMHEYQFSSPYRRLYKHVVMPTVDSHPQNPAYIEMYAGADAVATYSAYGKEILESQSNNTIKIVDILRPGFDKTNFYPAPDNNKIKESMLFPVDVDAKIIGTVMRNQKRKLFDDLFLSFRKYLDKYDDKTFLYCHTSYPDMGFNIPRLLKEHRIANKVLFTYVCAKCRKTIASFFSDIERSCPFCNGPMVLPKTQLGVTNEQLGKIYNLFDVYVQYAQAEGAGMPAVEAAGAGVPVMEVDFSAMHDYVRCLKGTSIPVQRLYREVDTHFYRAYPDNNIFVEQLHEVLSTSKNDYQTKLNRHYNALSFFNWDTVAEKWEKIIDSLNITKSLWKITRPHIHQPQQVNQSLPNNVLFQQAVMNLTGKEDLLHNFIGQKILRNLNYRAALKGFGGLDYNDESFFGQQFKFNEYTREDMVNELLEINKINNHYELLRINKMNGNYNPPSFIRTVS